MKAVHRILVVEDDDRKRRRICGFLDSLDYELNVSEARSYQSGLQMIVEQDPSLVILDMSMPTYDVTETDPGWRTRAFAGRDILEELARRRVNAKVIVVTQFENFGEGDSLKTFRELSDELYTQFPDIYIGMVYYHASESMWEMIIEKYIRDMCA